MPLVIDQIGCNDRGMAVVPLLHQFEEDVALPGLQGQVSKFVGYFSFDDKAADLLYEVVNRRYERKPVILTTNRPFREWNEVFPNAECIATLLDRLLHHADVAVIEGDSYRVRESEQETAARRRKK